MRHCSFHTSDRMRTAARHFEALFSPACPVQCHAACHRVHHRMGAMAQFQKAGETPSDAAAVASRTGNEAGLKRWSLARRRQSASAVKEMFVTLMARYENMSLRIGCRLPCLRGECLRHY